MRDICCLKTLFCATAICFQLFSQPLLHAQTDVQRTVRAFLQAWYVDRKSPNELKGYIAKDNGFNLPSTTAPSKTPLAAARTDPVRQLFTGAFVENKVGMESMQPKSLGDAIEYPPAKKSMAIRTMSRENCLASVEFAVCKPDQLPKGAVLPVTKPSGKDPVANYLWHLSQAYKNRLYIVLYSTKGAGLLRETAILYWIRENNSWKLAAFKGTNW